MVRALDVANYILYTAYKFGDFITNLKLQKLLYYVQADYLVENNGTPLFEDEIEAWKYGPVIRAVYEKYKVFGRNPINDETLEETDALSSEQKEQIEKTLKHYMSLSAYELVDNIHNEKPWQDAHSTIDTEIISTKSMYDFYSSLKLKKQELLAAIEN